MKQVQFNAGLTAASQSTIPFNDGSVVSIWLFIKVIALSALLLALAYGVLWFLKKKNLLRSMGHGSTGSLELLESKRLGPRTTLHLIRHGSQTYLVTESSQHVALTPCGGPTVGADEGSAE